MRWATGRAGAPGYTLMELVVASWLALLVIAGLWVVYSGHVNVFRGQEMASQTQVAVRFGMEVVKADLRRAGFQTMSDSNNQQLAQKLCKQPPQRLMAVAMTHNSGFVYNPTENIAPSASGVRPTQAPDTLTLMANYTDTEEYWVENIVGTTVTMQDNNLQESTEPFPENATDFGTIFGTPAGDTNLVRVRHQDKAYYSVQTASDYTGKTVTLTSPPPCLTGLWDGARLNVVNKIQYSVIPAVGNTLTPSETAVVSASKGVANRTDLVRDIIDWNTGAVAAREVVAENVVDFQVWFLFETAGSPDRGPQVDQNVFNLPDNFTGNAPCNAGVLGTNTDCDITKIQGAVVRISVRSPREDPRFAMPRGVQRPLQWYEVDPNSAGAAKVRTLISQFDIPNIEYGQ